MTTPRDPDERYDRPADRPADLPPELYTDSADAAARDPRTIPAERADVRDEVVDRQREQFGGVKIGSAFFGWLTATGMAVILTALVAATSAAIGLGILQDPEAAAEEATQNPEMVGWVGGVVLLVIVFVAYWCGGYVAGRMARFNGVRQGVAVWVWALVIAVVVALLTLAAGSQFDILGDLDAAPRIPVSEGELTTASIVTAIVVAIASLGGAILGGVAGTRYHRKVDSAGVVV
ncbi:hypothetical protein [Agromyces albus]|uniref:hypothetical protein n=1 Tax=Agromyces albus TaxID=205332 RepID=UPI0027808209|nr:hypothetical protein [Agromyces albus]MDQ0575659.1 hypothetical protein [Agromyces albus]